jgi:hypothetical protein
MRRRAGTRRRARTAGATWFTGLLLLGFVVALVLILTGGSHSS